MTTGTITLGRPAYLRSLIAGFTVAGLAVGLTVGILVTREVLEERAVPRAQVRSATAIWENSAAAVRERGATLPQARSAFENSTAAVREQGAGFSLTASAYGPTAAAIREQGAALPWYVVAARAGFTGRLGGATKDLTIVRRHGHLTPKSSVVDGSSGGPVMVNGEPCQQCL